MKRLLFGTLFCCFILVAFLPLASELPVNKVQSAQSSTIDQPQNTQSSIISQSQIIRKAGIIFCVEPWNLTVKEGDVFNISVSIENVPADPGLAAAEFHLSWDPTVLNGLRFIKVMFQDNSIGWDDLNSTEGLLFYVHALCSGSIAGTQTLAIVTFEAIGQGSTIIHFTYAAACAHSAGLKCVTADGDVAVEKGTGTVPALAPQGPTNVLYAMKILAGSAFSDNSLTLPPAVAVENVSFSINIEVVNVTDMCGWEFGLSWNNAVLNCTNVEVYTPSNWQTPLSLDGKIENNFTSTTGRYHLAIAGGEPCAGNITIATLTFNPIGTGTTPLTFDHVDMVGSDYGSLKFSTTTGSVIVIDYKSP